MRFARVIAAEDALLERDARQRDLERRLARHEGDQVMKEAANLNDVMTNAMRDVRGFFSRAGNDANERDRDGASEAPRRTSALRPPSRSMLSRFTSGGDRSRDPSAFETTPKSKTRVAFVDDAEQARLIKEGDYVAALAASRRACAELAETLGKREASLASTRRRAETTKASLTAAVAKLDDETARRKRAESELESVRFFVRDGDGDGAQHLRRSLTRARDIVRDALGAAASAASAGVPIRAFRSERRRDVNDDFLRFDAGAATAAAALPALAALAHARSLASGRERPGRVARDMLALGAANAATEAMAAYPRDATVATRACELLAALARAAPPPTRLRTHPRLWTTPRRRRSSTRFANIDRTGTRAHGRRRRRRRSPRRAARTRRSRASRRARRRRSRTPRGGTRRTRTSSVPSRVPSFDWRWRTRPSRTRWKGPARRK